eukprot:TRINITY_DN20769_c0_g1_i1.p1 TRINITY_DN20769_c0_g1~~TRINITY_DN20769_c0_g1_i1.p1  ORF type:complete len:232 (+),score=113.82 TRINITY_DN20769_c0_g1_i1:91-696(+)
MGGAYDALLADNDTALEQFISATPGVIEAWAAVQSVKPSPQFDDLIAMFDHLEKARSKTAQALESVRLFIVRKIPEIKDEDNQGVMVQHDVLKSISKSLASCGGPADKEAKPEIAQKCDFLSDVADRLKSFKERPEKTASLATYEQLDKQQDADIIKRHAGKIKQSWLRLITIRIEITTALKQNKRKLCEPRKSHGGMGMM